LSGLGTSILGAHEIIKKANRIKKWLLPKKSDELAEIIKKDTDFDTDKFCKLSKLPRPMGIFGFC
jgi:hypothetical protein